MPNFKTKIGYFSLSLKLFSDFMRVLYFFPSLLLLVGCHYLPFSSGKLSGQDEKYPDYWEAIIERQIIQLETNPSEPYSVNLWIVNIENKPYVYAGDNYAAWVKNIESDPRVVLKSGNSLYQLKAQRVLNADFFKNFAVAWEEKYGNRPRNENYSETYLFQLSRREER